MDHAVIVSGARTPVGKLLGGLSALKASELGSVAIREALHRAKVDPASVDEVIMGQVLQAGAGQNPARQAALGAGLPDTVAALTVNKVCGSSLKAVVLASQAIRAGDAEVVVAGGQESMSQAPYLLRRARTGYRLGNGQVEDSMIADGLWCAFGDYHMGITGENVAQKYSISREEQDTFALASHRKAVAARKACRFSREITPVEVKGRKGDVTKVEHDEGPREDTSLELLGRLKPAFQRDGGTVTAGNAPGVNDGAAAVVVMSEKRAAQEGLTPLARIVANATGGTAPEWVMMAPVDAVARLEKRTGWKVSEYDLIELNEAFSVQALGVMRETGMDPERVNVNGGAVALGHPIGASGARILVTLLSAMEDRKVRRGLATMCLGGGNAVALALERN